MGLTKQYLRFVPDGIFGVVASKTCNAAYLPVDGKPGRFAISGGTHVVHLWDTKFQRKVRTLNSTDSPAVCLEPTTCGEKLAVGHSNGAVSVYSITDLSEEATPDPDVTFQGHTSGVTSMCWNKQKTLLISGSKDCKVIVWDVLTETGVCKLIGHTSPVTRIRFWKEEKYLVSSSMDRTIKIWNVDIQQVVHTIPCTLQVRDFEIWNDFFIIAEANLRVVQLKEEDPKSDLQWTTEDVGTILRHAHDRPCRVTFVEDSGFLLVFGVKAPAIEVFQFNSNEVVAKRIKKRLKKEPDGEQYPTLIDIVKRRDPLKASEEPIKSMSAISHKGALKVLCCLPSNQMEVLTFVEKEEFVKQKLKEKETTLSKPDVLGFDGHRKIVRGIAFSSDKTAILTASADCFKLWNRSNLTCILTIPHEYPVVCCSFCPGDRNFIAGTTDGYLILGDVSTGSIIQVECGGNENVWGIHVYHNNMGFAASNGNFIQLNDFSMSDGKLRFDLKKQIDVQDSILCVKVSPNMKFIAVGLLDTTIKVFYLDTLKFHLSLYGHSLPIVSIDISDDSNLLVSCAGDKTVKVWGLDFGDCHCSMLHSKGMVGCAFLDKTHLCMSMAQDSMNIYDADSHQRVQTVQAAHIEGGASCVTSKGFYVASAGRDQTIRLYKRTQEILVLDDEREREREESLEEARKNESVPNRRTFVSSEAEGWADKVIETLDVYRDPSSTSPMLTVYKAVDHQDFLYKSLCAVKANELHRSIQLLPCEYVKEMITALHQMMTVYPLSTELALKCLKALLQYHTVTVKTVNAQTLTALWKLANERLDDLKDVVGINIAALSCLRDKEVEREQEHVFKEILGDRKRKRKRREKAIKRALLMV